MKKKFLMLLAAAALLSTSQAVFADDTNVTANAETKAQSELKDLITKVRTKLQEGKKTEADLSDELKQFDTLLAEHKGEKTEAVAQIAMMKASLYEQVLGDKAKGEELMTQLKSDYPDTKLVASLKKQEEGKKISAGLVEGTKFPDFDEKDVMGKSLSVGNYKGKVVLVDFWATWCGPCVGELPHVLETYGKHHSEGFEIVGISLDKDQDKLTSFTKEKNMTWQQYFDGQVWQNKLATKYGVNSIPATYLLDGEGTIIGKNLRGEALESAVANAVAKK